MYGDKRLVERVGVPYLVWVVEGVEGPPIINIPYFLENAPLDDLRIRCERMPVVSVEELVSAERDMDGWDDPVEVMSGPMIIRGKIFK